MSLTWRDGVATLPVAAAVGLYWAFRTGAELPLVSGPRVLGIVIFVLGVIACTAIGGPVPAGGDQPADSGWRRWFAGHGLVAFVLALLVVITGSRGLLAALAALVVLLWAVTTVRHAVIAAGHRGRLPQTPPLHHPARR